MHPWPMRRPPAHRRTARLAGPLVALSALVGGCGEAEIVPLPSHDLSEPWQAQPFAVDQALVIAAEQKCREGNVGIAPPGSQLVVVDARGGNRLTLIFVAPTANGQCFLKRDPAGRFTPDGGEGEGSSNAWPALGPTEVTFNGVGSADSPPDPNGAITATSHLLGRAGAAVASTEVVLPSGVSFLASLNRGWFAAWWPGLDHDAAVIVRGYDASGRLVGSSP
jgi:hypothetical protein